MHPAPSTALLLTILLTLTHATPQAIPTAIPAGVSSLPSCATPALLEILNESGCDATDTACLCAYPDVKGKLAAAVAASCPDASDQQTVAAFADGFCPDGGTTGIMTASSVEETSVAMTVSAATSPGNGGNGTTSTAGGGSQSPTPTPTPAGTGGAAEVGIRSLFGLAAAVGGMTWVFYAL